MVLGFGGSSKKTFTQSHKTHILPSENIVQLKVKRAPLLLRTSANLSPLGRKPCLSRAPHARGTSSAFPQMIPTELIAIKESITTRQEVKREFNT